MPPSFGFIYSGWKSVCFINRLVNLSAKVKKVRWPKNGLRYIKVDTPHIFNIGLPAAFQGQQCNIVLITERALCVEPQWSLRNQDFTTSIYIYIYDPQEAGNEVVEAWNGFLLFYSVIIPKIIGRRLKAFSIITFQVTHLSKPKHPQDRQEGHAVFR